MSITLQQSQANISNISLNSLKCFCYRTFAHGDNAYEQLLQKGYYAMPAVECIGDTKTVYFIYLLNDQSDFVCVQTSETPCYSEGYSTLSAKESLANIQNLEEKVAKKLFKKIQKKVGDIDKLYLQFFHSGAVVHVKEGNLLDLYLVNNKAEIIKVLSDHTKIHCLDYGKTVYKYNQKQILR